MPHCFPGNLQQRWDGSVQLNWFCPLSTEQCVCKPQLPWPGQYLCLDVGQLSFLWHGIVAFMNHSLSLDFRISLCSGLSTHYSETDGFSFVG